MIRILIPALLLAASPAPAATLAESPAGIDDFTGKPRVFVLTDIGNEPDDQMSLVRLLLYSNELEIEGLVATTSTWQKAKVQPEMIRSVIAAYGEVQFNLRKHAVGWPTAETLQALVTTGPPDYGMAALTRQPKQPLSAGAAALLNAASREDKRPLWISVWGGANTLAEALTHARDTRGRAEMDALLARLRVYSISDQDDAGPWIRREFPTLLYVVKPSPPNGEEYASATWTGISGDVFYRNGAGADGTTVTNEWLDAHVRAKGPLGKHYPRFAFIMEGDTPAFLGLLNNGLESFRSPAWGGWGGRYVHRQPFGETRAIWTQGGDASPRVTSADSVAGVDGKTYVSDQATIWRWRRAFQHDFAARMDWTAKDYANANHAPLLTVNGIGGNTPIYLDAPLGKPLALDANGTRDPDGDELTYRWWHYLEAGFAPGQELADVKIEAAGSKATITPTLVCRPDWLGTDKKCDEGRAHLILEVTDAGSPALTSYRRIILTVRRPPPPG